MLTAAPATIRVTSPDGTTIGARRSGEGLPLVLVHGAAADGTRWAPVAGPLAERFTVHCVDRRGRGESGDGATYAIEREYEDVAAYVDALPEPGVLLGHSYGAIVALEAARLTANLRALVLYEPPFPVGLEIYEPSVVERLEALLAAGDRGTLLTTFFLEVPRVPAAHVEAMRGQSSWPARVAAAHTIPRELRAVNEYAGGDIGERFADVALPALLLVGGASPEMLTAPSRILADTLADARTVVFSGHAHSAMDTASEDFVASVTGFVARL